MHIMYSHWHRVVQCQSACDLRTNDMYESVVSVDVYIQLSQCVLSDLSHKNEYMLLRSVATLFIYALSFYGDRNLTRHFASWHVVIICIHTVLIISLQCILLSEITNLSIFCWNVSSTTMYIYEFYFVIVEFFR